MNSGGAALYVRVHGVQASLCRMDVGSVNEKKDYVKNHFFAVDSFFSPLRNTLFTMLPSLIYADIID